MYILATLTLANWVGLVVIMYVMGKNRAFYILLVESLIRPLQHTPRETR